MAFEHADMNLASWGQTRVKITTAVGLVLPVLGCAATFTGANTLGLGLTLAGFASMLFMPRALTRILDTNRLLDEREMALRLKAYGFSYRLMIAIVSLTLLGLAWAVDFGGFPSLGYNPLLTLAVSFSVYSLIMPLAYMAWTVTPPDAE